MQVNDTRTITIFLERGMFSVLFNAKKTLYDAECVFYTWVKKWECCSNCKKINSKTKQYICTEFCVWLEKMAKETIALLKQAFRDTCLSNLSIKRWHK